MNTSSDVIWQFWQGPMPDYIAFCLQTVEAHHPGRVQLLTEIPEEMYRVLPVNRNTRVQQLSDVLRAYLLWKHGGYWLDADFLCMQPIDRTVEDAINLNPHFATYRRLDNGSHEVDYLWAARWSWVTGIWVDRMFHYLQARKGNVIGWADIGAGLLDAVFLDFGHCAGMTGVIDVPAVYVSPFRALALALDAPMPDNDGIPLLNDSSCGLMLVNSAAGDYLSDKSVHDICSSRTVIGHLFREALRRLPK